MQFKLITLFESKNTLSNEKCCMDSKIGQTYLLVYGIDFNPRTFLKYVSLVTQFFLELLSTLFNMNS